MGVNVKTEHGLPVIAAALIAAVILFGFAIGAGWVQTADLQISQALALRVGQSSDAVIAFMQWASWIGGGTPRWIIVILLCGLVWHWCGPRCAVALGGASLLSNLASSLLKLGFARPRPDVAIISTFKQAFPIPAATRPAPPPSI